MTVSITVQQTARPQGLPTPADFEFVHGPVPDPAPGSALVENLYLSVDPYHRELMDEEPLRTPLEGRAIGRVVLSRDPALAEGDLVLHRQGWRTHAVVTAGAAGTRRIRHYEGVPLSAHLGILGGTGLTAYVALTRILKLRAGEDLFVTAAAGGVGTAAGRIARLLGAGRIIGSAGSRKKVEYLTDGVGYDAAFDYHDGPVGDSLAKAAPDGVHAVVENVGGDHLEGAIAGLRDFGRIAWVGAVSQYNNLAQPPAAPRNLFDIVAKSIRLEGVLVRDHRDAQEELEDFLVPHLRSGRVTSDETVIEGFEGILDGFIGMLSGSNTGKLLIHIGD
ncbi:NADP-dependent oxidoreductase [Streptomyces sp. NPDC006660]|uniref:NADP-dependent oxidoreductase n=1 Tax=Streptomyces sp. NPDC006660 TaxID=3156901 RepID=UPI0033D18BE7